MKNYKTVFGILFMGMMMTLSSAVQAQDAPLRTIAVQGTSTFSIPANQASIVIGVESSCQEAQAAVDENARVAASVQAAMLDFGIPKEAMRTEQYSLYPVYKTEKNMSAQIAGYNAVNTVTITTERLEDLGKLLSACVNAGANKINSIAFSAKNSQDLEEKALRAAVKNAEQKARIMAASLGKTVVNVVSVSENNISMEGRRAVNYALKSGAADAAAPPIQAGTIKMTANISVVFEIE